MKFYCHADEPQKLGVLSQRHVQLFDFDGQKLSRTTMIDVSNRFSNYFQIPEIQCFEWVTPKQTGHIP